MYGKCYITALDESLNNVRLDFNLGAQAIVNLTEITAEQEYTFEIEPFQYIGTFDGANVYLSWAEKNASGQVLYDRDKKIKGKLVRTLENGEETSVVITFEDAYGLLGERSGSLSWFQNVWLPNSTFTKID